MVERPTREELASLQRAAAEAARYPDSLHGSVLVAAKKVQGLLAYIAMLEGDLSTANVQLKMKHDGFPDALRRAGRAEAALSSLTSSRAAERRRWADALAKANKLAGDERERCADALNDRASDCKHEFDKIGYEACVEILRELPPPRPVAAPLAGDAADDARAVD
ncbi:MAG: hypothetical protein ACHREM_02290 [Polyangiales bacterium]